MNRGGLGTARPSAYGLVPLWLLFLVVGAFQGPTKESSSSNKPPCAQGQVWLAKKPGKINFSVVCHLADSGWPARLGVVRFSTKEPRAGSGIRGVSESLTLGGAGAEGGRGSCFVKQEDVSCVVHGHGRVHGTGWIDVAMGDQCKRRVGLSVTRPPKCSDGYCDGVLDIDYLWKRLPDGC